jgi:hypothetical protein
MFQPFKRQSHLPSFLPDACQEILHTDRLNSLVFNYTFENNNKFDSTHAALDRAVRSRATHAINSCPDHEQSLVVTSRDRATYSKNRENITESSCFHHAAHAIFRKNPLHVVGDLALARNAFC